MAVSTLAFFNAYAEAYESYSPEAVAKMYFTPSVVVSDDRKTVFTSDEELFEHIQSLMNRLKAVGVTHCVPEVCQTMRLAEHILFSNVNWSFTDEDGQHVFSCFVSYTLQVGDDNLKVIVSVIDDEERELAKLTNGVI
ncbi:DUF6841 family protein [Alteromonas sp. a30]|uniref:DUF6841 family protein n=1 Tax=Alteromonas sp. a30 TaxID=2730917 RepID=UPI00227E47B6|nr:hypothetical protein [Alteromonas sp. a30]MCY7297016.1 hypothetical protein [Alteromonas sp. a30]